MTVNNTFYTYRHIRPDTGEVFYIGKGYKNRAYDDNNRNKFWKHIVYKNNGSYIIEIITKDLTEEDAILHEIYLIDFYGRRDLGRGTLVNLTNGGEGTSGRFGIKYKPCSYKKIYKRTEQGLIDNRDKRRAHKKVTKLDVLKVIDIKTLLNEGKTLKFCANKYNVAVPTIQCIKDGRTWSDIKI